MKRCFHAVLALCAAALAPVAAAPALAQGTPAARVERFPGGLPDGPWSGRMRFGIGGAADPALRLRLVGPESVVRETAVAGGQAHLDAAGVAPGEYALQLVRLVPGGAPEIVWERWPVTVAASAPGARTDAAEPVPAPDSPVGEAPVPAPPAPLPAVRLARVGGVASGVLAVRVDGARSLPSGMVPVVSVEQDGRVLLRSAEAGAAPHVVRWDTRAARAGVCVVRLWLVAVDGGAAPVERDRMEVFVGREALRSLPSRGGAGRVGGGMDGARRIAALSQAAGDPWPRVAAAQWALESAWGQRPSGVNNVFGIKSWDGTGTLARTREWENGQSVATTARFADYPSLADGVAARVRLLRKPRYDAYWSARTEEEACLALQRAGYATDPAYAQKLTALIGRF